MELLETLSSSPWMVNNYHSGPLHYSLLLLTLQDGRQIITWASKVYTVISLVAENQNYK